MKRRTVIRTITSILIILFILFCVCVAFNTLKSKRTNDGKYISIETLDEYYSNSLTKQYKDIRNLPKDYGIDNLKEDKGYIVTSKEVFNENTYKDFIEKYNKERKAFIRVGTISEDGNLIIHDLLYDSNKELLLIEDNTRDTLPNKEFKIVRYKLTKTIEEENITYWILYNEEKSNLLEDKDTFILTEIKE